jgi:hypothetical protein
VSFQPRFPVCRGISARLGMHAPCPKAANPLPHEPLGTLSAIPFLRLHDVDVLTALTDPVMLFLPDTVALLQLLTWENPAALGIVPGRLASVVCALAGTQLLHVLPGILGPVREVLSVRDNQGVLRAYYTLFSYGPGLPLSGVGLLTGMLEGSSQGWGALRKMLLLSCVEPVVRALTLPQLQHLMSIGMGQPRGNGVLAALVAELATVEAELHHMEATDPQAAAAAIICQHRGAVTYIKSLLAMVDRSFHQALQQQVAHVAQHTHARQDFVVAAEQPRPSGRAQKVQQDGAEEVTEEDVVEEDVVEEDVVEVHLEDEEKCVVGGGDDDAAAAAAAAHQQH